MRTLSQIRDEVMAWMDEVGEENLTKTNVDNAINRAHEMRCAMHPWHFMLWPREEQFTTVANQTEYTLHPRYHKPLWFWNSTSKLPLREVPFRNIPMMGLQYQQELAGTAAEFSMVGRSPIQNPIPAGGDLIRIVGGSSTTGSVQIQGYSDYAEDFVTETITLTGEVFHVSTTNFVTITRITKLTDWTVPMYVVADTSGTALLSLGVGEYGKTYPQLMLYAKPPSGEVVKYRFYRTPEVLVNDYDIPDIPHPYDGILVFDTLLLMTGYNAKVSPVAIEEWRRLRSEIERQMFDFDAEQSLHGYTQFTNVDPYAL